MTRPDPRQSHDIITSAMLRRAVLTNRSGVVRLGVAMGMRQAYLEALAPLTLAERVWCGTAGLLTTRYDAAPVSVSGDLVLVTKHRSEAA